MRFGVGGVNHQACCGPVFFNEFRKDFVENPQTAPPDKTIVKRLVRSLLTGSVFPLQTMLDDVDYSAGDKASHRLWESRGTRESRVQYA